MLRPNSFERMTAEYMDQLRRLREVMERMDTAGYALEGEGWALVPPDLIQDFTRLSRQLDEGRFSIGNDDEEV